MYRKIIKIHECNSIIIGSTLALLQLSIDKLDVEFLTNVISVQRLKESFSIFKRTSFDVIHENIIQFLKTFLLKKTEKPLPKANNNVNTSHNESVSNNISKMNTSNCNNEEENVDIITMFSYTLHLLKEKIKSLDFDKLAKAIYYYFTYIYIFCNLVNNMTITPGEKVHLALVERRISEQMVEVFSEMYDKKIFEDVDKAYGNKLLDTNLINLKILIFRSMFHFIMLIRTLKSFTPQTLTKEYVEKILKMITAIKNNDKMNPKVLIDAIESMLFITVKSLI